MLKSKKGISPILATLLLIVIAVAAIIITYAWVTTYMRSTTGQAGVFLKKDADCLWQTGSPSNTTTVYVRNTGTSDAEIDKVYINSEQITSGNLQFTPSSKIVAKEGGTITIVVTYNWTSGATYNFQISPKVGEPLGFEEKAP
ncbi:MAG: archaellin/type IV pilin N-terminal domain-containing protein [Thermoproteota archaeon]|nr:archaellin/type IV pilin N-terminal domain-containing protein [Thermoproteota archaeon]